MPIRTTPTILHTKLIATITQINVIQTMMRIRIVVIAARNNLFKENSFASAVGFSLFSQIDFHFVSRGDEVIFLFSLVPSWHEEICLRRRRINCAPMEHHFHFSTGGGEVANFPSTGAEVNLCAGGTQVFVICFGRRLACATALAVRTISAVCF